MKYIPADKLIAKIVELRKELPNTIEHLNDEESGFARGQQYELTAIEEEILCLQQEQSEVDLDLEKACDAYCKVCGHYPHTVPTYICRQDCEYFDDFKALLNARKEK